MPTFLNLYHILSVYNILRPPKYGNITVTENEQDKRDEKFRRRITFSGFQTVFAKKFIKSYRVDNIKKVKNVIKDIIVTESWDSGSVSIDDALSSQVLDSITYSNTGFLCYKMSKKLYVKNCDTCAKAFSSREENAMFPIANLIELRTRGKLIFASFNLFEIVKAIDELFNSYVEHKSNDAFDKILHDLRDNKIKLTFPCDQHKVSIMSEMINYYIFVCMQFFKKEKNRNEKKTSKKCKKEAKLKTQ